MMFSEKLVEHIELARQIGTQQLISPHETERLLVKATEPDGLSPAEIITLLNGLDDPANARVVVDFSRSYSRPRDGEVFLLPPLYFSSICENKCAYCDFSTGGQANPTAC